MTGPKEWADAGIAAALAELRPDRYREDEFETWARPVIDLIANGATADDIWQFAWKLRADREVGR